MKKTIKRIGVLSVSLLTLAVSVNAQWSENATSVWLTNGAKKVGIGTPAPSYPLDIKQAANCSFRIQSITSGSANLILSRSAAAGNNCLVNYKTGATDLWYTGVAGTNTDFRIRNAAGTDNFFISQTTGAFGFNTTAPSARYHMYAPGAHGNYAAAGPLMVGDVNDHFMQVGEDFIQARYIGLGNTHNLDLNPAGGDVTSNLSGGNFTVGGYSYYIGKLEVAGLIGNTAASFGTGQQGLSIVASYPGIYYNSYYNGGTYSMAAGYSGNISMDPSSGYYSFTTSSASATSGSEATSTNERMSIANSGIVKMYSEKTAADHIYSNLGIYAPVTSNYYPAMSLVYNNSVGQQIYGAGSGVLIYNLAGNAYAPINASAFNVNSDRSLKKDIYEVADKDYSTYLDQIRNIESITYRYNNEVAAAGSDPTATVREFPHVGFTAQSLPPAMIAKMPVSGKVNAEMKLGYNLSDLAGLTLIGVKALDAKTQSLEAQNESKDLRISALEKQVADMNDCIQSLCNSNTSKVGASENNTSQLFQNTPNPFNQTTVIKYALNSENKNGKIIIRDLNGNLVKQINIANTGKGQVTISANELTQGTYTYTLDIAGVSVDTKLMVVTK